MATAFAASDHLDLVTATLADMQRGGYSDITHTLRNHVFLEMILNKEHVDLEGEGKEYQFNMVVQGSTAASNTLVAQPITPRMEDHLTLGQVPWRNSNTNWAMEDRIVSMQTSATKLVDLLQLTKSKAYEDLGDLIEANAWTAPPSSSDDLAPYGVPYWITKASGTPDFQGAAPSGFTTKGGISPTTYPNYKNWTGQYAAVTKDDLVRKIRKALRQVGFKPAFPKYSKETGPKNGRRKYEMFTTYSVVQQLEDLVQSQNDNLGSDLARFEGDVMIKRTPVQVCDYLDQNDATNPVYGFCWDYWKIGFLNGEYINESPVRYSELQHRTFFQHVDLTYNFCCWNVRYGGWVLYV